MKKTIVILCLVATNVFAGSFKPQNTRIEEQPEEMLRKPVPPISVPDIVLTVEDPERTSDVPFVVLYAARHAKADK